MKAGMVYVAIFALGLFIIPIAAAGFGAIGAIGTTAEPEIEVHSPIQAGDKAENEVEAQVLEPETPDKTEEASGEAGFPSGAHGAASFKVLDEATGTVSEISLQDFVRGAVAAEMPAMFHLEALKAQAVAAHTYALHSHREQLENPDPALKGADFRADPSNMKVYITEKTARGFYGEAYADMYWDKVCEAADSVLPYIMEYEGEPIAAAYHAISGGRTEDAANVWNGGADYLSPVESRGDYLAPGYEESVRFTLDEAKRIILSAYPDAELPADPAEWFSGIERSESGYITAVNMAGVELHGKDVRTLFGLRSHNMDIFQTGSGIEFVTYGYGHGVGLSQHGADFMARQGHTFDEILDHYYSGIAIKQIEHVD